MFIVVDILPAVIFAFILLEKQQDVQFVYKKQNCAGQEHPFDGYNFPEQRPTANARAAAAEINAPNMLIARIRPLLPAIPAAHE